MATRYISQACIALTLMVINGCQLSKPRLTGNDVASLENELKSLETLVAATREDLQVLNSERATQLDDVNKTLARIDGDVKRVPALISNACQTPEVAAAACEEVAALAVVTQDDKMILGQIEQIWINPPGLQLRASIDTGAASNSIHATNVTPFERDGDNWVRFELGGHGSLSGKDSADTETVDVEKKVVRLLKTSKRPVVRLRVRLGNVLDSFDFILRDRSNDNHPVELGRNFLQDIALVDVGKQFVQPSVGPTKVTDP